MELSDVVEKESTRSNLKEKIGIGLTYLASLHVIPYIYNRLVAKPLGTTEILASIADQAGNIPHIMGAYYGSRFLETILNTDRITKPVVGLVTIYHVLGEIFNSEIAPHLPKILPGTPDIKDILPTIMIGLGLYLSNRKI